MKFFKRVVTLFSALFLAFLAIGFIDFENIDYKKHLGELNIGGISENETSASLGAGVKEKVLQEDEVLISRAIDGDTVLVINSEGKEERVRLLLIDTPESVHPNKPAEKFGKEASEYAKQYLKQGTKAILEKGVQETDNYGRTLGYLFVDGVNFNKHMIEKGYARVAYVYEPNTRYLDEFRKAEKRAKEQRLNIWSIDGYVTDEGFDMSVVD